MKIAIIEDDQAHADLLCRYLEAWSKYRDIPVKIMSFSDAESFLFTWMGNRDFEVLFVDTQMKKINGMEMAKRVRDQDTDIAIVVTTDVEEGAAEDYGVEAMRYLSKPISQKKLYQCMNQALEKGGRERFVLVQTKDEILKLAVKKIMYVEAREHGCVIEFCPQFSSTFQVETTDSISVLEERLGKKDFARCHRSFICRIDKIRYIRQAWIELNNGSRIPVSRKEYSYVNQAFIRYYRRERMKNRR